MKEKIFNMTASKFAAVTTILLLFLAVLFVLIIFA
jgi:hypothetical protein